MGVSSEAAPGKGLLQAHRAVGRIQFPVARGHPQSLACGPPQHGHLAYQSQQERAANKASMTVLCDAIMETTSRHVGISYWVKKSHQHSGSRDTRGVRTRRPGSSSRWVCPHGTPESIAGGNKKACAYSCPAPRGGPRAEATTSLERQAAEARLQPWVGTSLCLGCSDPSSQP